MKLLATGTIALLLTSANLRAAPMSYEVTVTNLTKAQGWGKPIVAAHNESAVLFTIGETASAELQALAEEGDHGPLAGLWEQSVNVLEVHTGDAPLAPGQSVVYRVNTTDAMPLISLAGMLGTSNDTFAALTFTRPEVATTLYAEAYDAGTESNNELCAFIPGPPCMNPGIRDVARAEGMVVKSNGIEGIGDLDMEVYGWDTEVLKIDITPKL